MKKLLLLITVLNISSHAHSLEIVAESAPLRPKMQQPAKKPWWHERGPGLVQVGVALAVPVILKAMLPRHYECWQKDDSVMAFHAVVGLIMNGYAEYIKQTEAQTSSQFTAAIIKGMAPSMSGVISAPLARGTLYYVKKNPSYARQIKDISEYMEVDELNVSAGAEWCAAFGTDYLVATALNKLVAAHIRATLNAQKKAHNSTTAEALEAHILENKIGDTLK